MLRVEWLLDQPDDYKMQRRQDLEKLEHAGRGVSPLLRGKEAVAFLRNGEREIGALSYGWLLPWDPDPTGARMILLRQVLTERTYIKALFWDQATLYQPPRGKEEDESFYRALKVMMDLYASAIGTTCASAPVSSPVPCALLLPLSLVPVPVAVCCRSRTSRADRLSMMGCFAWEACRKVPMRR